MWGKGEIARYEQIPFPLVFSRLVLQTCKNMCFFGKSPKTLKKRASENIATKGEKCCSPAFSPSGRVENIVGKRGNAGGNAGFQHFLLCPQYFKSHLFESQVGIVSKIVKQQQI